MKDKIWDLFKLTGDIKYYIMYKELERLMLDDESESEGNNNTGY